MLTRLVYVSTAVDSIDLSEFRKILGIAQQNNRRRDLTGMMAFNGKVFLQGLEGSRETINALYAKLTRDPRHVNITILKYESVSERQWANWSMGFAAPSLENRSLFLRYSEQSTFNPYNMTGDNAEKMLLELSSTMVGLEGKEAANQSQKEAAGGIFSRFLR